MRRSRRPIALMGALALAWASLALAGPARAQADGPESDSAQSTDDLDWEAVQREASRLLSRYIRVNTTNPPGNEIAAARFLRDVLVREGIEFLLLDQGDGKAALVGRLRAAGTPAGGAVILLNHMDVVAAAAEDWSVDPFGGTIRDGSIWGRGALDMKGVAVAQLMAMVTLARHGPPLRRDIIFLATSDEEIVGGQDAGTFLRQHGELLEGAEFLINEGGTIRTDPDGTIRYYGVGVTEKSPFWLRVTARGTAGHGSLPIDSSAVNRLIRALERVRTWETPLRVTPPVEELFRRLAEIADTGAAELYRDIGTALADSAARARILADRYHNAILRNTISITGLEGSPKTNVIPSEARAELDTRLLPGASPDSFLAALRARIGAGGDSLTVRQIGTTWPATISPTDGALFNAIEETAHSFDPDAAVLPYVLAGFTDSHYFREVGIESYGVGLFRLPASESARIHGVDERLSVENLGFGVRFLYEILVRVAG